MQDFVDSNHDDEEEDDISTYAFKSGNSGSVIDIQKEMDQTIFDDMLAALINSRFIAPLVAL